MAKVTLEAHNRDYTGSNKARQHRRDHLIPAVIYGKNEDNKNIQVLEKDLDKAYKKVGTSAILTLDLDGEDILVLIRDVQMHPYKNQYTHVDFLAVNANEAIKVNIPIVLDNRDEIRLQPSVLAQQLDEIELECLPADIPQTANYDVIDMQYNDQVLVSDLDIFGNDKLTFITDPEELVAVLNYPEEETEEEETEESVDASDVPTVEETEESEEDQEEEEE